MLNIMFLKWIDKIIKKSKIFYVGIIGLIGLVQFSAILISGENVPLWVYAAQGGIAFLCLIIVVARIAILFELNCSGRDSKTCKSDPTPNRTISSCVLNGMDDALIKVDQDGCCTFVNERALQILDYSSPNEFLGHNIHKLIHFQNDDHTYYHFKDCPVCSLLLNNSNTYQSDAETFWKSDGSPVQVSIKSHSLKNTQCDGSTGRLLVFTPADARHVKEKDILRMAFFDNLTGLPNRESLNERMEQALTMAERKGEYAAVMFLDLDRFKNINDSLGHEFGDKLLIEVSNALQTVIRKSDIVARWGGDEFVVLLPSVADFKGAALVAEKILNIFNEPFEFCGKRVSSGTSIGIAMYPENGRDAGTLLKNADAAMYEAKNRGRGTYNFFSNEISSRIDERLKLSNDLRHALEYSELELFYQPQIDLSDNKIIGVEALLRWNHPTKGYISPLKFLAIAEEEGMILDIGRMVIAQACTQLLFWRSAGITNDLSMSINVNSQLFMHPEFIPLLEASMRASGLLGTGMIELEVKERTVMEIASPELLCQLERLKVPLVIDDFGTGYSSLTYLKHFPISKMKIDGSFLEDLTEGSSDCVIIKTIIAMADALGHKVVAEAVETKDQADFLALNGCSIMQGYYFTKPLSAQDAETFIREWPLKKTRQNEKGSDLGTVAA